MLTCFLISGTPNKPSPSKTEPVEQDSAVSIDNSPDKRRDDTEATSKICVVFDETITFLDEALNVLKNMDHTDIDDDINWMNCFISDITPNHNSYIMACEASPDALKYKSVYNGGNSIENTTFVARCNMNSDDLTIDLGSNECAMLLKKELVNGMLEFAPNKLVMFINPTDLLIANNWQVVNIIKDPRAGNCMKQWLQPLPGFDSEQFPFIVTSGKQSYNLVNLKTYNMQVLIDTPALFHHSQ